MNDEARLYTLIAELTYRCPLRCPYCSNPLDFTKHTEQLSTADWQRVLTQAEDLGALQVTFTGGEPLLRSDLELLVEHARGLNLYVTLITSGIPLTRQRLSRLREVGLDAVQVSVQDAEATASDRIAGTKCFGRKLEVMQWVKELGLPLTINAVLHRENLNHVEEIVRLAEGMHADRLELANTQYLGWALPNRDALLPTEAQIANAREVAKRAKERLKGKMEILFVLPDYYSNRPKPCMNGWAKRYMLIAPDGRALPCHLAHTISGLSFESVQSRSLSEIWTSSPGFLAFRGDAWMSPTCRSCDRKDVDFGGCRCQAFHLTGDASATDPVCSLSPHHGIVQAARGNALRSERLIPLRYRGGRSSTFDGKLR